MSHLEVWKYELPRPSSEEQQYSIPEEAQIIDYQIQDGKFIFWALVDPDRTPTERCFVHTGTGWYLDYKELEHVGTVQEGKHVWHLFEVIF
jgi:hypothetical protein